MLDGHALQCLETIQISNQKTAGDSETASDVEVTGFATELLLTFTDGLEPPEWPDLYAAPPHPPAVVHKH